MTSRPGFKINIFPAILLVFLMACSPSDHSIQKAIRQQLELYPASTLEDIYKSFFQDEFGPGHLSPDSASSAGYLEYELSIMASRGNYTVVPCGEGKNFCRVPLDLVKDGVIPKEEFLSAFLESAKGFKVPDLDSWKIEWDQILREVEAMHLDLHNFEWDKEFIAGMLKCGEMVIHHSDEFTNAYDPHYRIMSIGEWKKMNSRFQVPDSRF